VEKKTIYEELYWVMVNNHLNENDESYLQHLRKAMYYSGCLLVGSACAFVHAVIPFVMTKTTTKIVRHLSDDLK